MTFKDVENCYYEGNCKPAPAANTRPKSLIYHELARYLVWVETDGRGFTVVKAGDILGMGGQLTWKWESIPSPTRASSPDGRHAVHRRAGPVLQNVMMSVVG